MVFLKVASMKGVLRFGRKGKLSPQFIGPFEILERIGPVAYVGFYVLKLIVYKQKHILFSIKLLLLFIK